MKIYKIFLVSILLICLLTTSILLCACNKDNDDWIKIYKYISYNLKYENCYTIIRSVQDVTYICDEDTSPIFNNDERNNQMIETLKEYDEEFFIDKSLVVLFRTISSIGYYFYVKDYEINEESLNIVLARDIPNESVMYPLAIGMCMYIFEFPKEQIKDVTQINVRETLIYQ